MQANSNANRGTIRTGYLPLAFPRLANMRLPFSRDQAMLTMAATNEIFLGIDIVFAHSISGTITPREWIPIVFGPIAGVLLFFAGWIAIRRRNLANYFASIVFAFSILVGLLGGYFHLIRAILPSGPIAERVTIDLLVWAPPILGPFTFSLVGLLGLSAAWLEEEPGSGVLRITPTRLLRLPYSKTRAYFLMVSLGVLATVISSVLDHARTPFENPWLWLPTAAGVFGVIVAFFMGASDSPTRADVLAYILGMLALILVGVIGLALHVGEDLTSQGEFVLERFIRGAPFMAPLLFADMGTLGLLVLLDPRERPADSTNL